jgi:hypothetical protein
MLHKWSIMPSRPSWKNLATLQAAALLFLSLQAALLFRTIAV